MNRDKVLRYLLFAGFGLVLVLFIWSIFSHSYGFRSLGIVFLVVHFFILAMITTKESVFDVEEVEVDEFLERPTIGMELVPIILTLLVFILLFWSVTDLKSAPFYGRMEMDKIGPAMATQINLSILLSLGLFYYKLIKERTRVFFLNRVLLTLASVIMLLRIESFLYSLDTLEGFVSRLQNNLLAYILAIGALYFVRYQIIKQKSER